MLSKNYIFTGKVNVGVAVGAALATLFVIIIVVVGYWFRKFKSKESVVSHELWVKSAGGFKLCAFTYILNLNKKIYCFPRKFTSFLNEKSQMLHILKMYLCGNLSTVSNKSFRVWLRIQRYNGSMTYVTKTFWNEFFCTNKLKKKFFQWINFKRRITEDLVFQRRSHDNGMLTIDLLDIILNIWCAW